MPRTQADDGQAKSPQGVPVPSAEWTRFEADPSRLGGSVRPRASEYGACLRTCGEGRSGRFEEGQHGRGPAEQEQSTAVGGDVLVVAGAGAEEVAELVVSPAEPGGRSGAFETPHGPVAALETAVILFQPVVLVAAGPVPHTPAQLGPDRPRVAVVAIGRDPVGG